MLVNEINITTSKSGEKEDRVIQNAFIIIVKKKIIPTLYDKLNGQPSTLGLRIRI